MRGLLGVFLADGYLSYCRTPTGAYVRATLDAGPSDRDFLEEKVNEIRQSVSTKGRITSYQTPPRASGETTTVLRFRFTSNALRPIYNLLYPNGDGKEITSTVLELLGGRAAAWLWAEGARRQGRDTLLGRVGSSETEAALVSSWIQTLTGAESEVTTACWLKPKLHFKPEAAAQVRAALQPYAPNTRRHLFFAPPQD